MILASVSLSSCSYENVEMMEVSDVKIHKFDTKGIEFTAKMRVENPNAYKIQIVSTDADLYLSGKHAGKAKLIDKVVIPANFNDIVEAHIRTDFNEGSLSMLPLILGVAMSQKLNLRATGKVRAKSFLIGRNFDFDYSHEGSF